MRRLLPPLVLTAFGAAAHAEPIGSVDTVFKFIGPDHKIVVDAYDDPKVAGVTCYVSRAKTGGIKGARGAASRFGAAAIRARSRHCAAGIGARLRPPAAFTVLLSPGRPGWKGRRASRPSRPPP
jgi:hypothetical protein